MKGKRRVLEPQATAHVQRTPLDHDVHLGGKPVRELYRSNTYRELFPVYGHDWWRYAEPYLDVEFDDDE